MRLLNSIALRRCLSSLAFFLVFASSVWAGDPKIEATIEQTGLASGFALTAGCDLEVDGAILAAAPDWVLLSLTPDVQPADERRRALRQQLASATAGRVVVQPLPEASIPIYRRAAALLVVDTDALADLAPTDAEIERALRPFGMAWIKRNGTWTSRRGTWPETIADHGHWFGGPELSAQTDDREIGQVKSLRWHTGRMKAMGDYLVMAGGVVVAPLGSEAGSGLAGFDAFSGLRLWRRPDVFLLGNYTLAMDRMRVVVPSLEFAGRNLDSSKARDKVITQRLRAGSIKPMALDVLNGRTLRIYDNAPALRATERHLPKGSNHDHFFNLAEGKLVVISGEELAVLDADDGSLLWKKIHTGAKMMYPSVDSGRLVLGVADAVERPHAHGNFLDRDLAGLQHVIAYSLSDGRELWKLDPANHGLPRAHCTMIHQGGGSVWISLEPDRRNAPKRAKLQLLRLKPADGELVWRTDHPPLGPTDIYARTFIFGDNLFLNKGTPHGLIFDLATGEQRSQGFYNSLQGSCLTPRASATHLFHSGTSINGAAPHSVIRSLALAGRCHKGGFPGHGMLLGSDSHCDCQPFLLGLTAFGSDDPPQIAEPITVSGPGRPGVTINGDAWRTAFRDAARSSWGEDELKTPLKPMWTTRAAKVQRDKTVAKVAKTFGESQVTETLGEFRYSGTKSKQDGSLSEQWDLHATADFVGGPVLADGVTVVTLPHAHEIVALEPETGEERWRHRTSARVNGPATLAGGMVLFGNSAGWVSALSINDGRLVWRTRGAPGSRYRVESGQLESSHPIPAPVTVVGEKVYTTAGLHSQVDGGIHFVELDLASGKFLSRRIYDGLPPARPLLDETAPFGPRSINSDYARQIRWGASAQRGKDGIPGTSPSSELTINGHAEKNGPLVLTPEGWLGLGNLALDPVKQTIRTGGTDFQYARTGHFGYLHRHETRWPRFQRGGPLSRKDSDAVILAGILGRAIAYRDDLIVAIGASDSGRWGVGVSRVGVHRWRSKPLEETSGQRTTKKTGGLSAEVLWRTQARREPARGHLKGTPDALAVSGDTILVAEQTRLYVYGLMDGEQHQVLDLPAPAVAAGIAVARGQVIVSCEDGSLTSFHYPSTR